MEQAWQVGFSLFVELESVEFGAEERGASVEFSVGVYGAEEAEVEDFCGWGQVVDSFGFEVVIPTHDE
jgi:hypothetical protein